MLEIRGATKTYFSGGQPVQALRGIDIHVAEGGFAAVLGPSGSGKTTLLRALAGFERLDSGEVKLAGETLSGPGQHVPPERRGIGMLAQQGALFPHLDVAANVGFGLQATRFGLSRAGRAARTARVGELLALVGLRGCERRRVDELSGGQQQRVALARALAPAPKVMLLDEPFASLDANLRAELREEVSDLLRRVGATVVLVTHDQEEALSLADQLVVMRAGEVTQAGPPATVYATPDDPGTARFLGEAVLLKARLAQPLRRDGASAGPARVLCALGEVEVRNPAPAFADPHGSCIIMLRPEQLQLARAGAPGRVVGCSFFGHDAVIRVRVGMSGDGPLVLVRTMRGVLPAAGDTVHLRVDGEASAYPVAAQSSPTVDEANAIPELNGRLEAASPLELRARRKRAWGGAGALAAGGRRTAGSEQSLS